MSEFEQINYEVRDGLAVLTLNRPERLNAFTVKMRLEMMSALDMVDEDDQVRVLIVTGQGRAFCAGHDMESGQGSSFARDSRDRDSHRDGGGQLTLRLYRMKKPVIAAINGPAVGIGLTMTLPMDFRLASVEARMGFVFARRGIVTEACSNWFLPRLVGLRQALDWSLTGKVFSAEEALAGGLVRQVLPTDELMPAALVLARDMADNCSAASLALIKQLMWSSQGQDHPMAAHRLESKCMFHMAHGADSQEGVQSFLEKRPARFTMKVSSDLPDFYPWLEEPEF